MKQFDYTVADSLGICATNAGALVKAARQMESTITVKKENKIVSAKNLLDIIRLGVKGNETIRIRIEGSDEEQAEEIMKHVLAG